MGKVALVSGGGSGHEPMHGGLVGKDAGWCLPRRDLYLADPGSDV